MKYSIRADALPSLLDCAPENISILSLDCFDTLLWRNAQAPYDVFADLDFEGGGIWPRTRAESRARQQAQFDRRRSEVSIEEIYRQLMPSASDDEIEAAVAREIEAEARHCFGFAPTAELMRAAKARGLSIIIVSDTYLNEAQLRGLIAAAAGAEVAAMIDRIFCSSEYGYCKTAGLFRHVLEALGVPAAQILHVGDNIKADQDAAYAFGLATAHLRQFDPAAEQRLRLEAAAATILDPRVRTSAPAYQPHRPHVALRTSDDPVWTLGHDVLGPVLHAFARWVRDEVVAMAARLGRPVKPLFLLRDGHLPKRVFETAFGAEAAGTAIELSRFTARRAGFTDEAAVRAYLATRSSTARVQDLARQLGLTAEEGAKLARNRRGGSDTATFVRAATAPDVVRKIVTRSRAFADRVFAHFRAAGVERGDAVMLVDLGYNGTVQNHAEPMLRERFGLAIAGRYLLLREEEQSGLDKRGFLDRRHYDTAALHALCGPIAVVEQLCTIALGSVVDYRANGDPVRKKPGAKGAQNSLRDRVQEACVAFAREAGRGVIRPALSDDGECRRAMAAATLARLLFMPSAAEVRIFENFEHDVNLGTDDMIDLLDGDEAARGLRRRGLFYLSGVERMYLPGEIQPHGLPLNLSLFSTTRFNLDLRSADFRTGAVTVPVIIADERSQTVIDVEAHATHDGYYLATVPVGAGRFGVGIQFGALCSWVQIDEAAFYPVTAFTAGPGGAEAIPAQTFYEGMTEEAESFFRCEPGALMLAPPSPEIGEAPHLLAVTFRPIVRREACEMRKAA